MITNRTIRFPAVAIFLLLLLVSLAVTYLMVYEGFLIGVAVLGILLGSIFLAAVLKDFRIGLYAVFLMGIFMFYVDRMLSIEFPIGTIYDALVGLTFIAMLIERRDSDWRGFKNPVTVMFIILIVYQILQLFNPSATSSVAWLVSLRNNISFLVYVICFQMFSSFKELRRFTHVWIGVTVFVALYGIFQKLFGLSGFEQAWMNEKPERIGLYVIWGQLRVFSFLSDPSSYGLFTGAAALGAMVLAMGPFKPMRRCLYGLLMIVLLVGMSFSGTRTAIAVVILGLGFYILLMLHNKRTLMAAAVLAVFGAVLMFGPFYGATMSRVRSTFMASDDPSMAVRDRKRTMFQDYIHAHPIGGGLFTVGKNGDRYSPGHPLAGDWDPDSGYLLTALETGWIGLLIFQGLFLAVMLKGINAFYGMRDPVLQTYVLVYIVPFMALSVAHFAQDALFHKPTNIIVYATYAVVVKITAFQKKLFSVDLV